MNNASTASANNDLLSVLVSGGPSTDLGSAIDIYGWLVGSWDIRVIDYNDEGDQREQLGEWHFAWALEGRAIQDVFIVPRRGLREGSTNEGNRYGSTLRMYDAEIDAWRISWRNPVSGARNELIGRPIDGKIIQEGIDGEGRKFRWIFDEIKADSFHWYGERSYDGGETWKFEVEFFAVREK